MADYPKFSDFATGETKLDGEKIKLKDILNQETLGWLKHCDSYHLIRKLILDNSELISLIASHSEQLSIHNPLEDFMRKLTW